MYRIRLASGAETTYNSMDEFATALQDGAVTADALIYHQRADRWLAVTNHPHYQIALARPSSAVSAADASKRQVITAVRPSGEAPATRIAPRLDVPVRKLAIPVPAPKSVNVHSNGNGAGNKTAVLPLRTPVRPPESSVPDLGEGLDLVEDVASAPTPVRPSTATPQVDKLLEMLNPTSQAAPALTPVRPEPEVELLDLNAPLPKKEPLHLETAAPAQPHLEHPHTPVTYRRKKSPKVVGMAVAAVVVMMAIAVFLMKPWAGAGLPVGSDIASTTLPRTEAFGGSTSGPAGAPQNGTETPTAAAATQVDSGRAEARQVDSAPAIVRIAAPRNLGVSLPTANLVATGGPTKLNIGAGVLIQHYNAAYNEARSELELRMLQIGFTQIFLRSRVTTSAGVQDTRRLIASASSALRHYRGQESQIERSYQDTVGAAGRNLGWTPRDLGSWNTKTGLKESGETLRLTNLMLSQMDSTFSLLAEQEGKFRVSGETITFENAEAARQYSALRVWLNQQADKYSGTGDALPATLRQVVKAIGSTRLPQERR